MAHIKCPKIYNGKPVDGIKGFSIGPDGSDRTKLINEILEEDDRSGKFGGKLRAKFNQTDEEEFRLEAAEVFKKELDTAYNIEPGQTVEVPDDHAEILTKNFGFLERVEVAPVEEPKPQKEEKK